jgi:hypothetical protein
VCGQGPARCHLKNLTVLLDFIAELHGKFEFLFHWLFVSFVRRPSEFRGPHSHTTTLPVFMSGRHNVSRNIFHTLVRLWYLILRGSPWFLPDLFWSWDIFGNCFPLKSSTKMWIFFGTKAYAPYAPYALSVFSWWIPPGHCCLTDCRLFLIPKDRSYTSLGITFTTLFGVSLWVTGC